MRGNLQTIRPERRNQAAFSLVELVMVVTIIAIIAAIAVPRISNASNRARANALAANITNVRAAIDQYYAEHGRYPGYNPGTGAPNGTWFVNQLTKYTDQQGNTADQLSGEYRFGPYLRRPFPANPINNLRTVSVKALASQSVALGLSGWVACLEDGSFTINASQAQVEQLTVFGDGGGLTIRGL